VQVSIDGGKPPIDRDEMSVDIATASVHIAILSINVAETHVDITTTPIHTFSPFVCNAPKLFARAGVDPLRSSTQYWTEGKMNRLEIRWYEMLVRVNEFGIAQAARFPPPGLAAHAFAVVGTAVGELNAQMAEQASGRGAELEGTSSRAVARDTLRDSLATLSRTARAIAIDKPGLEHKFRLPRQGNDERLIASARGFVQDAKRLADQFIAHGHPATFIADLNGDIDAFARTIVDHSIARDTHVAATISINNALDAGLTAVRRLDAIVPLVAGDDARLLAMWNGARHVTRVSPSTADDTPAPAPPVKAA